MNEAQFIRWLAQAKAGDSVVYFTGFLATMPGPGRKTAKRAWKAYEEGKVNLVQQRVGEAAYLYIAQKRKSFGQRLVDAAKGWTNEKANAV